MLKELKALRVTLNYSSPLQIENSEVLTFLDAAFNISSSHYYDQSGLITGFHFAVPKGASTYHLIDWNTSEQRHMTHFSYGAELISCLEADDCGFCIKTAFKSIVPNVNVTHKSFVDSKELYVTHTILYEGRYYRLPQTVQLIRDCFGSGELSIIRLIQRIVNMAGAFIKMNPKMLSLFNRVCTSEVLDIPPHSEVRRDTEDRN